MAGTRPPDEDRAYRLLREWSARAEGETTRGEHAHVLDNITTAFFALDHEWRLTHVNQQAAQSFQRPRENLLGKPLWEALPALIGTPFETELRRALHERTTVEFEALHPLSNAWVEVQAQPSNGGLAVYFQDVAERKRSEEPPFE
ncbi:MAG TPA: PAS domain-containing protein, partial [Chloroflexota bacterium]